MPEFKPDEQTLLPGILPVKEGEVPEEKELKPQEEKTVPEVTVKYAQREDGLEEKCAACGDAPGGCPQCGFGRK
ncbi:MAG: hypothetical protein WC629_00665 [Candidatus Paceibacterota bacterium]|jgi:hypothetical protein